MKLWATLVIITIVIAGCTIGTIFTQYRNDYQEILIRQQYYYFIEFNNGEKIVKSFGYKNLADCEFALKRTDTNGRTICGQLK